MALFNRLGRRRGLKKRRALPAQKTWWEIADEFPPEAFYDPANQYDPSGSYTGKPVDGGKPVQDADDL